MTSRKFTKRVSSTLTAGISFSARSFGGIGQRVDSSIGRSKKIPIKISYESKC